MRELTLNQIDYVSGGKFRLSIRLVVGCFATFAGFCTGGPVGAGLAASAFVGVSGVANLAELYDVEVY